MSGEWDGLRAAAEAATTPMTCGGHRSMGSLMRCQECLTRANGASDLATAATPAKVLGLLDRLQAAEAAVERVRDCVQGWSADGHYLWERMAASDIRDALDGPQDAATGEVALGSAAEPGEPQITVQVCDHPDLDHDAVWSYCRPCPKCGICKFIGHGPLCLDCYSASGAESDHGGRRDGEGLA